MIEVVHDMDEFKSLIRERLQGEIRGSDQARSVSWDFDGSGA